MDQIEGIHDLLKSITKAGAPIKYQFMSSTFYLTKKDAKAFNEFLIEQSSSVQNLIEPIPIPERQAFSIKSPKCALGERVVAKEVLRDEKATYIFTKVFSEEDLKYFYSRNGNYLEQIQSHQPRRFYLDIEFMEPSESLAKVRLESTIRYWVRELEKLTTEKITPQIQNSSGVGEKGRWLSKYKHSYHVIFEGAVFSNHKEMSKFFHETENKAFRNKNINSLIFIKDEDDIQVPIWDGNVYHKTQMMRLVNNSKLNSERILKSDDNTISLINPFNIEDKFYDRVQVSCKRMRWPRLKTTPWATINILKCKEKSVENEEDPFEIETSSTSAEERLQIMNQIDGRVRQSKQIWEYMCKIAVALWDEDGIDVWIDWTLQQERYKSKEAKQNKINQCQSKAEFHFEKMRQDLVVEDEKQKEKYKRILTSMVKESFEREVVPFNPLENYYWSDFSRAMTSTIFSSQKKVYEVVPPLARKVVAVINDIEKVYIIKKDPSGENDQKSHQYTKKPSPVLISYRDDKDKVKTVNIWNVLDGDFQHRSHYSSLIFKPYSPKGSPAYPETSFNTFQPFVGQLYAKSHLDEKKKNLFHANLLHVLCNGCEESYNYMLDILAFKIQQPWLKPRVALFFYSEIEQVGGKGLFILKFLIKKIFGRHAGAKIQNVEDITTNHNGILADKSILNLNEPSNPSKHYSFKAITESIKDYITEDSYRLRLMNKDGYMAENLLLILISSNNAQWLGIKEFRNRLFPIRTSTDKENDARYWSKIAQLYEDDAVASYFYNFLLEREIREDIWILPQTPFTEEVGNVQKKSELSYFIDLLEEAIKGGEDGVKKPKPKRKRVLLPSAKSSYDPFSSTAEENAFEDDNGDIDASLEEPRLYYDEIKSGIHMCEKECYYSAPKLMTIYNDYCIEHNIKTEYNTPQKFKSSMLGINKLKQKKDGKWVYRIY